MKKLIALILALALTVALCVCGTNAEEAQPVKIGVLAMLNLSEEKTADYYYAVGLATAAIADANRAKGPIAELSEEQRREIPQIEAVFYDSLDAMLMALNAGDIQVLSIYSSVADYLIANNDQLEKAVSFDFGPDSPKDLTFALINGIVSNSFSFMMLEGSEALRDEFNQAIAAMDADGTFHTLIKEQMLEAVKGTEIKPVEMPVFEGAETIKVAVTGSLPPLDYVSADNIPAGYNTAVLAEISRRIGKNIEISVIESAGRSTALASGAVDAVFWTRSNAVSNKYAENGKEKLLESVQQFELTKEDAAVFEAIDKVFDFVSLGQIDMPEGTIITEPYFIDAIVPVQLKK